MFYYSGYRAGGSSNGSVLVNVFYNVDAPYTSLLSDEKISGMICREFSSTGAIRVRGMYREAVECSTIRRFGVEMATSYTMPQLEHQAVSVERAFQLYPAVIHAPCASDAKQALKRLHEEPRSLEVARTAREWLKTWIRALSTELDSWSTPMTLRMVSIERQLLRSSVDRLAALESLWPEFRGRAKG
jgi:hypothetical protein